MDFMLRSWNSFTHAKKVNVYENLVICAKLPTAYMTPIKCQIISVYSHKTTDILNYL